MFLQTGLGSLLSALRAIELTRVLRVAIDGGVADGNCSSHASAVEVYHGLVAASHLDDAMVQFYLVILCLHLVAIDELLCQPLHLDEVDSDLAKLEEAIFGEQGRMDVIADLNHRTRKG